MTDLGSLVVEAGPKAVLYAALLLAIGASATRWLLLPRTTAEISQGDRDEFERALGRFSVVCAVVFLLSLALRAGFHTVAVFGWRESLAWDQLSLIILESRWGSAWRLQVGAAAFLLAATFLIRVHRSTGWLLTAVAVVACAASMPLLGHAASNPFGVALHASHILGGGLWLGTLCTILLIRRAGASRVLLRQLSPMALTGASVAVAAGAIAAVQYVGSPANLWETPYGRALVLKLLLFAAVLRCGYLNWRQWSASASEGDAAGSFRLPIAEALLAAAIVLVTSVLTELAHP